MKLRIWGTEVTLSLALLPFLFVCIVAGETNALFCAVIALLLHECSHGIAVHNLGYRVTRLSVYPFGAVMELESLLQPPAREWIAAIAGPLGSFVAAAVAQLCMELLPQQTEWFRQFAETNLAIAALNLLPIIPLDGGRIAKAVLLRAMRERTANRILFAGTCIFSAASIALGAWMLLHGVTAWLLFALPPFFILSAVREVRDGSGPVRYALLRQGSGVRSPQKATVVAVHPLTTVGEAIQAIRPTRYTILHVTDGTRSVTLEEGQLLAFAAADGYEMPLHAYLGFDQPQKACYTKLFEKNPQIGERR